MAADAASKRCEGGLGMRSGNRSRGSWVIVALAAPVAAACGGSTGTLQLTIDASTPDASAVDAAALDAATPVDASVPDATAPRLDATPDAPVDAPPDGTTASDAPADGPEICNSITNAAPAVLSTLAD